MSFKKTLKCSILFTLILTGMCQGHTHKLANYVGTDESLFSALLSNSTPFNNELIILNNKKELHSPKLYLGGYAQGGFSAVDASSSTYFYSTGQTYQSNSFFSLDRIALSLLGNINNWASVYFEEGATDIGQSYASSLRLNQSYILLGDGKFPLYGFAGYKNIDFGDFSTVNLFAQPITRWDYAGTALTVGGGFQYDGLDVTLSELKSGTQGVEDYYGSGLWRVYNYPNYYSSNQQNNYAVNTSYQSDTRNVKWRIGAGYMRGLWLGNPVNFFNDATIGAWDVNAALHAKQLTLLGEFVASVPNTLSYGSFTPFILGGSSLQTWDVGASYHLDNFIVPRTTVMSADASGVIGNNQFAQVNQWVFGVKNNIWQHVWTGIEYVSIAQESGQSAMRSGLFYRAHNRVNVIRLDLTAEI